MKYYIGVDLGGTNVRSAIVDESGQVISELKRPSYALEGPKKVIGNIVEMIEMLPDYCRCEGIGIGVPGPVDTRNGMMTMSTNLPGFTKYPFAAEMAEKTGYHLTFPQPLRHEETEERDHPAAEEEEE